MHYVPKYLESIYVVRALHRVAVASALALQPFLHALVWLSAEIHGPFIMYIVHNPLISGCRWQWPRCRSSIGTS